MKRFGINNRQSFGVKIPEVRRIARPYKNDHDLALQLWKSPIHKMKILATIIDDPKMVTMQQVDEWTADLYSWYLCDQLSVNLLSKTDFADELINRYIANSEEFIKRTAFVIIASLATNDKSVNNQRFANYAALVSKNCDDHRNFVKKSASWALKNIGKRNINLARFCIQISTKLEDSDSKAMKWIGKKTISDLNKFYETK